MEAWNVVKISGYYVKISSWASQNVHLLTQTSERLEILSHPEILTYGRQKKKMHFSVVGGGKLPQISYEAWSMHQSFPFSYCSYKNWWHLQIITNLLLSPLHFPKSPKHTGSKCTQTHARAKCTNAAALSITFRPEATPTESFITHHPRDTVDHSQQSPHSDSKSIRCSERKANPGKEAPTAPLSQVHPTTACFPPRHAARVVHLIISYVTLTFLRFSAFITPALFPSRLYSSLWLSFRLILFYFHCVTPNDLVWEQRALIKWLLDL